MTRFIPGPPYDRELERFFAELLDRPFEDERPDDERPFEEAVVRLDVERPFEDELERFRAPLDDDRLRAPPDDDVERFRAPLDDVELFRAPLLLGRLRPRELLRELLLEPLLALLLELPELLERLRPPSCFSIKT